MMRSFGLVSTTNGKSSIRRYMSSSFNVKALDTFERRHIGSNEQETKEMLNLLGYKSLDALASDAVPAAIKIEDFLQNPEYNKNILNVDGLAESDAIAELKALSQKNIIKKSFIGMGFHNTKTPYVIKRNMVQNHQWLSAYTPYQAEISQGRMEMLLNFQTVVSDLTKLPFANCSLLDEASAAAESVNMCYQSLRGKRKKFFVAENCHPHTLGVVETRCKSLNIELIQGKEEDVANLNLDEFCGVLLQYPDTNGVIRKDNFNIASQLKEHKVKLVIASDLLALTMITPPGEFGADVVVGTAQRFGVPMFFGGPHAGFMSTTDEMKRLMPGRLIGVSIDSQGNRALRMALQAREQFIRREKALSNICTAQALLANIAAAYTMYHGPEGLLKISNQVHNFTKMFYSETLKLGFNRFGGNNQDPFFDTVILKSDKASEILKEADSQGLLLRQIGQDGIGISFDEGTTIEDVEKLINIFGKFAASPNSASNTIDEIPKRESSFLQQQVFSAHQTETKLLRYMSSLESRDITLKQSMIPLGSCTMKLNAAAELDPILWEEFCNLHPYAPAEQSLGSVEMVEQLNSFLALITGFAAVSSQPNSGATGEYAGLLAIRAYHESRGDMERNVCLIPQSAHGTNGASAVLCGMKVVGIKADESGNVDLKDLEAKAIKHKDKLSAFMITYPSTYGKFEVGISEAMDIIHDNGGQVYMDGANLNAQLGMCSPGTIGADVCHLNLHKTFAIPHGGGGPGVGSIGVAEHLAPFLPGHKLDPQGGEGINTVKKDIGQVAAAPYGSAGILPISWMFIKMMGANGLLQTSQMAILNANYMAKRLSNDYTVLYGNENGLCAHEFILDFKEFKSTGVTENDVAKRLADYGFHAPTTSWPQPSSLMVEPTESESKDELDKYCDALISIRKEIQDIQDGKLTYDESPLHNAPHTAQMVSGKEWDFKYSRQEAAFPDGNFKGKFWPTVSRVDASYGDRNLVCSCEDIEAYESF